MPDDAVKVKVNFIPRSNCNCLTFCGQAGCGPSTKEAFLLLSAGTRQLYWMECPCDTSEGSSPVILTETENDRDSQNHVTSYSLTQVMTSHGDRFLQEALFY